MSYSYTIVDSGPSSIGIFYLTFSVELPDSLGTYVLQTTVSDIETRTLEENETLLEAAVQARIEYEFSYRTRERAWQTMCSAITAAITPEALAEESSIITGDRPEEV
jgi:hypothetical protein